MSFGELFKQTLAFGSKPLIRMLTLKRSGAFLQVPEKNAPDSPESVCLACLISWWGQVFITVSRLCQLPAPALLVLQ